MAARLVFHVKFTKEGLFPLKKTKEGLFYFAGFTRY